MRGTQLPSNKPDDGSLSGEPDMAIYEGHAYSKGSRETAL